MWCCQWLGFKQMNQYGMNRFTRTKPVPPVQIFFFVEFLRLLPKSTTATVQYGVNRFTPYYQVLINYLFNHELKFCPAQRVTKMQSLENIVQQNRKKQFLPRKQKEKRLAKDMLTFLKAWYPSVKISYLVSRSKAQTGSVRREPVHVVIWWN